MVLRWQQISSLVEIVALRTGNGHFNLYIQMNSNIMYEQSNNIDEDKVNDCLFYLTTSDCSLKRKLPLESLLTAQTIILTKVIFLSKLFLE